MAKQFSISTMEAQVVSAIKETLNIAAAASSLALPKTTLSSILSKLEKKLESHIFIRKQGSGEVTITDFGREIIPKLEKILWISESIQSQTDLHHDRFNAGKVTLVATQTMLESFIVPYVGEFIEQNPHIRLTLHQKDSDLYHQPQATDLFIGQWERNSENYIYFPFHSFRQKLWAAPSYLEKTGPINSVEDILHRRIIVETGTVDHELFFSKFGISLVEQELLYITSGPRIIDALVEQGVGIMTASEETTRLNKLNVVPILPNIQGEEMPLFLKADQHFMENPFAQFVTDWIFSCRDRALRSINIEPQSDYNPLFKSSSKKLAHK